MIRMRQFERLLVTAALCVAAPLAWAQSASSPLAESTGAGSARGTSSDASKTTMRASQWLQRMQDASRQRAYTGTFVVSSAQGHMASSRIWHVCDGTRQLERVDSLTGEARSTFRSDQRVVTFLPEARVVRESTQDTGGLFPNVLWTSPDAIDQAYFARWSGKERVAGLDADVVSLQPSDAYCFGYRIWSERRTGLVVKVQTLDTKGQVLEQAAFSELSVDAPVNMERLQKQMQDTRGFRIERADGQRTTPQAEGWQLAVPVPGFQSMSCVRRSDRHGGPGGLLQWVFSDGLATLSLFIETYDPKRHLKEVQSGAGATHSVVVRKDGHWVTAVGEVPPQTLQLFVQALARR